jgi:chaperonin GroES
MIETKTEKNSPLKKIAVYGNRVLIKEDDSKLEATKSGIIIPGNVEFKEATGLQKHLLTGAVLEAGEECNYVKKGDTIMYGRGDKAEIEYQGDKYSIIRESAVMLKMDGDEVESVNNDRVLVVAEKRKEKTESGIFIPDNAVYEPTVGVALKVGSECKYIKEGDKILFGKNAGMPLSIKDKELVMIREADVIGQFN